MELKDRINQGTEFDDIVKQFPHLLNELVTSDKYNFGSLTEGTIHKILDSKFPVAGVYVLCNENDEPWYVGRSKTLAQRIGVDHRSNQKTQANFLYKFAKYMDLEVTLARKLLHKNLSVRMIRIDQPEARALFEVYATMKLDTYRYNSFIES